MNISCGMRAPHTLAATENGIVWSWGDGSFGKLGTDSTASTNIPLKVMDFENHQGVAQLECGTQFSVLLTKDGKVFTW